MFLPSSDEPYFVVMIGGAIMLDNTTFIDVDDLGHRAPPCPIATFSCYVRAMRAARRIARSHATPVWID